MEEQSRRHRRGGAEQEGRGERRRRRLTLARLCIEHISIPAWASHRLAHPNKPTPQSSHVSLALIKELSPPPASSSTLHSRCRLPPPQRCDDGSNDDGDEGAIFLPSCHVLLLSWSNFGSLPFDKLCLLPLSFPFPLTLPCQAPPGYPAPALDRLGRQLA